MQQTIPATLLLAYSDNDHYLAADAASETLARGVARLRGILTTGRAGGPTGGRRPALRPQARPIRAV